MSIYPTIFGGRGFRSVTAFIAGTLIVALLALVPAPRAQAQTSMTPWGQVGGDIVGLANTVALSGDGTTVAVGDTADGVVRVYRSISGSWQQFGDSIDPASDVFGASLALDDDGDTLIVGSRGNGGGISDVARVYRFDGAWTQVGRTLLSADVGPMGASVDISGDGKIIAVSHSGQGVDLLSTYREVSGDYVQFGQTLLAGPAVSDVAISNDGKRVATSSLLGGTTVYRLAPLGDEWQLINDSLPSASGVAISDFANIVALALPGENKAQVYRDVGGKWQVGANLVGEAADDSAGASIAMSGDGSVIAVGAPGNGDGGDNAGHMRIYKLVGALWRQAVPDIDGKAQAELTGWSASMDSQGTRVVIGAPGQARIFASATAQDDSTSLVAPDSVLVDVLANDGVDPTTAELSVITQPSQAMALIEGKQIRYEPGVSTETTDSFVYEMCVDTSCSSATVTVSITPPTCRRQSLAPLVATIWGTNGPDTITTEDADDVIVSFGGDDTVEAGHGLNTVCAGDGNDTVTSGDQPDFVRGGLGNDTITTGLGIDRIFGGGGDDLIAGEGGSDRIRGASGDDTIHAGSGADRVWGGSGDDTLFGNGGQDFMYGDSGNDEMQGNFQTDVMRGGEGNDTIRGAGGKDKLYGDEGDDLLFGGANTDYLEGGPGNDTANGQSGRDRPLVPDVSGCDAEIRISC